MRARAAIALVIAFLLALAPAAVAQNRPPSIGAPSAILVEASTGDVIFERAADESRPVASTTKLMTALVALDTVALDDTLTVPPYDAGPAESLAGLRTGERLSVEDLLTALMLPSGNDAAVTLATGISGSVPAFVTEMNERADQLGLRDSRFTNPIGLDQGGNASSARDLVKLTLQLRRYPAFREIADLPRATLTSGDRRRVVLNRNRLVRDVPFVDGVKTGRTNAAGYVLVGSATRRGVTVVSAVLGTPSEAARDADSLALLEYGLSRYRRATVLEQDTVYGRADLKYRDEQVRLVAGEGVRRVIKRGEKARVRVLGAPSELEGPLPAGARVGTVEVSLRGDVIAKVPLVTATAVDEATLGERISTVAKRPGTVALLLVLLACTVLLVLLRRRVVRRAGGRA